jgi:hypothetical protein
MTGKTGMTSNQSVTMKKFALNFSQQKKDLNAEQKKTAALEQRLREMESALSAGILPMLPNLVVQYLPTANPSIFLVIPHTRTSLYHRNLIHC